MSTGDRSSRLPGFRAGRVVLGKRSRLRKSGARPMPAAPPPEARKSWGRLRTTLGGFAAMHDWRARLDLLEIKLRTRLRRNEQEPVELRMGELDGGRLVVRPGTADMNTIILNYVQGTHLPPRRFVNRDLRQICELGTQIGTGLAGLAARYPQARALGVEPDPENAALARRNIQAFGTRCQVIEAAIWDSETELTIEGSWVSGYTVRPSRPEDPPGRRVQGTTVDRVLEKHMPEGEIDYMVMSLEGTEPRVLAAASDWAPRVASIRCATLPAKGFRGEDAVRLLTDLGFDAWWEPNPGVGWTFGVRR
jgi:FkbM family methyltransferase